MEVNYENWVKTWEEEMKHEDSMLVFVWRTETILNDNQLTDHQKITMLKYLRICYHNTIE